MTVVTLVTVTGKKNDVQLRPDCALITDTAESTKMVRQRELRAMMAVEEAL